MVNGAFCIYTISMKLAKYWAKDSGEAVRNDGSRLRVVSRGWSNESVAAAGQRARETAGKLAAALAAGQIERSHYLYGERPLPEPILREFQDAAVVTRNSYGAVVLNTNKLMFIDIDKDDAPAQAAGNVISSVMSLFGKAAPAQPKQSKAVDEMQRVAERNGLSLRVYKTAAGYRAIVTSSAYDAASGPTEALLQQFDSDPLYVRLCRAQESFRARLTAKPWRCGVALPPVSFPFASSQEESQFRQWEAKYSAAARQYATCRYITGFGAGRVAPEFAELIQYHDKETNSATELPLA
jgi:hypothetical protein